MIKPNCGGRKELKRILVEPKNALTKQYKKTFELEGVNLEFTPDAIEEIATEAIKRHTGARGLKSILEGIMIDLMYDIPSKKEISKVVVSADVVKKKAEPLILTKKDIEEEEKSA